MMTPFAKAFGVSTNPGQSHYKGRIEVHGTRDGVDIDVIIGADGKTIINAYPTSVPRNPNR